MEFFRSLPIEAFEVKPIYFGGIPSKPKNFALFIIDMVWNSRFFLFILNVIGHKLMIVVESVLVMMIILIMNVNCLSLR